MDNAPVSTRRFTLTLTLYLARRFALYVLATLVVLGALTYLIDTLDLLGRASNHNIPLATIFSMAAFKMPNLVLQLLPFGILLATLITLNQLNRSHELVALRAAGMPARRMMLGPLVVVIVMGAFTLAMFNPLAATMLKRFETWQSQVFPGTAKGLITQGGSIWLKQTDAHNNRTFIYAHHISPQGQTLSDVTFLTLTPNGTLHQRLHATQAKLENGAWQLTSPTTVPAQASAPEVFPTPLTPALLQSSFTAPATLSVWELGGYIETLAATGFPTTAHSMAYHRIWALPAFLVAMFLLGVPFALTFNRTRNLARVIGAGLGLGLGFYLFGNFIATLGMAGRLNPMLAAWTPTFIAALLAMALLVHLREE